MALRTTANRPHDIAKSWSRVHLTPVLFSAAEAVVVGVIEATVIEVAATGLTETGAMKAAMDSVLVDAAGLYVVQLAMMTALVGTGILALHVSVVAIPAGYNDPTSDNSVKTPIAMRYLGHS